MKILAPKSAIKNVQRGLFTITSAPSDVTISAVDMSKSFLSITDTTNAPDVRARCRATLTSATNINFTREYNSNNTFVSWELIEYV